MQAGWKTDSFAGRLADPHLDPLFCSCEAPECNNSWISAGYMTEKTVRVEYPPGGRCRGCGGYFCRKHYRSKIFSVRCPRCGDRLDGAPRVANGRRPMQTVRLNQPLVHIMVMREGRDEFGPDYIEGLLRAVAPDAFEQDGRAEPKISTFPLPRWPERGEGLALAAIAQDYPEYLTDGYDIYIQDGRDQQSVRWLLAKVFAKTPKIVDSDALPQALRANTNALLGTAEDALYRPAHHLGPDHPGTLSARGELAHLRGEAGDAAGAAAAFEEVVADLLRVQGPDHLYTLTARNDLAHWRGKAGVDESTD
jgi:hypothetical protein